MILDIRVQPGARRNELAGPLGNRLKIRLQAPPVDGQANHSLLKFLAELCGVPRSRVQLVSGQSSRNKRVCIEAPRRLPDGVLPANM